MPKGVYERKHCSACGKAECVEHIGAFSFQIIESGHVMVKLKTADGEVTGVLNPRESHRLVNHLFTHRGIILDASKQQMKERESKAHESSKIKQRKN